jgi:hypothetical protein
MICIDFAFFERGVGGRGRGLFCKIWRVALKDLWKIAGRKLSTNVGENSWQE